MALRLRQLSLKIIYETKASHLASCFSMADLLAYILVDHVDLVNKGGHFQDDLIISKGHASAIYYAALYEYGLLSLDSFEQLYHLGGHLCHHISPTPFSMGSLGHGLSLGLGVAYAKKLKGIKGKTVVILSDGECQEGATWEAFLMMGRLKESLSSFLVFIDNNKWQALGKICDILPLHDFVEKLKSFHLCVVEVSGHSMDDLSVISTLFENKGPLVVVANTVKGKGVPFMEDDLSWHYRSPSKEEYEEAMLCLTSSCVK